MTLIIGRKFNSEVTNMHCVLTTSFLCLSLMPFPPTKGPKTQVTLYIDGLE